METLNERLPLLTVPSRAIATSAPRAFATRAVVILQSQVAGGETIGASPGSSSSSFCKTGRGASFFAGSRIRASPTRAFFCGEAAILAASLSTTVPSSTRMRSPAVTTTTPRVKSEARSTSVAGGLGVPDTPRMASLPLGAGSFSSPSSGGDRTERHRATSRWQRRPLVRHERVALRRIARDHGLAGATLDRPRFAVAEPGILRGDRDAARVATARDHPLELHRTRVGRLRDHRDPALTPRAKGARVDLVARLSLAVLRGLEQATRVAQKGLVADRAEGITDERIELRALGDALLDVDEPVEIRREVAGRRRRIDRIAKGSGIEGEGDLGRRGGRQARLDRRRGLPLLAARGEEKREQEQRRS